VTGSPEIWVCHLGVVDYREALALQERLRAARQDEELPDLLLTLEHPPVYTRGRRSQAGELPMGESTTSWAMCGRWRPPSCGRWSTRA